MNQPNEQLFEPEPESSADYNGDVIAWANHQAALLRAGQLDQLDIENIAEEIEDVGTSEQREFENRLIELLMHRIKQQYQPEMEKSASWLISINKQRTGLQRRLRKTPSLKPLLDNPEFITAVWDDATLKAEKETGLSLEKFPSECPWMLQEIIYGDNETGQALSDSSGTNALD